MEGAFLAKALSGGVGLFPRAKHRASDVLSGFEVRFETQEPGRSVSLLVQEGGPLPVVLSAVGAPLLAPPSLVGEGAVLCALSWE